MTENELDKKLHVSSQNPYACYEIGEYYRAQEDHVEAVKWYQRGAEMTPPSPMALYALGYAAQNGEGIPLDLIKALHYYEAAAQWDIPQACLNLAYFYQNGLGCTRNLEKALRFSERASEGLQKQSMELESLRALSSSYAQTLLDRDLKWQDQLLRLDSAVTKEIGKQVLSLHQLGSSVGDLQNSILNDQCDRKHAMEKLLSRDEAWRRLAGELSETKQENGAVHQRAKLLASQVEELTKRYGASEQELCALQEDNQKLKMLRSDLQERLQCQNDMIRSMSEQKSHAEYTIKNLLQKNDDLVMANMNLQKRFDTALSLMDTNRKNTEAELSDCKQKLEQTNRQHKLLTLAAVAELALIALFLFL